SSGPPWLAVHSHAPAPPLHVLCKWTRISRGPPHRTLRTTTSFSRVDHYVLRSTHCTLRTTTSFSRVDHHVSRSTPTHPHHHCMFHASGPASLVVYPTAPSAPRLAFFEWPTAQGGAPAGSAHTRAAGRAGHGHGTMGRTHTGGAH